MAPKGKKVNKNTAAQRAAQSARDKAAYRAGFSNRAGPRLPSGKFFSKGPKGKILSAPVANSRVMMTGNPELDSSMVRGDARIRVQHREYIQDLTGDAAFTVQQFPINPGMNQTFPWLSSIAQNFEKYNFRKLKFEYEPRCSTATAGSIMNAVDYDAADPAPIDKTAFMTQHGAVSSAPWEECCFVADPKSLSSQGQGGSRYIRTGALAANLDIKTYDVGVLNIATQGGPATDVGELYVSYDVELMTPSSEANIELAGGYSTSWNDGALNSVSKSNYFGTSQAISTGNVDVTHSGNVLTFHQVGQWLLHAVIVGTGLTTSPSVTPSAGASATDADFSVDASGLAARSLYLLEVTAPGQTFTFAAVTGNTSITAVTERMAQYQYALG